MDTTVIRPKVLVDLSAINVATKLKPQHLVDSFEDPAPVDIV